MIKINLKYRILLDYLGDMVALRSVNPEFDWYGGPTNEKKMGGYLAKVLKDLGFAVEIDEVEKDRFNVIGRLGKGRPKLVFNGHMDTVPPGFRESWRHDPFKMVGRNGRLYGLGVTDMKGAIASMLTAAEFLDPTSIDGELVYAFVVDEEVYGKGASQLIGNKLDADGVIIGEPTELHPCVAHKGVVRYRVKIRGKSAHSSTPWKGVNAISQARKVLEALESWGADLKKIEHPILNPPTLTITMINAGVAPSIVPEVCTIIIDRRTLPDEKKQEIENSIRRILDGIDSLDYDIEELVFGRGMETDQSAKIVKVVSRAIEEVLGVTPKLTGMDMSTDGRFFVNQRSIPTVILGPGRIDVAHTPNESIPINSLIRSTDIYLRCIKNFLIRGS